jgi:hypothetical protein
MLSGNIDRSARGQEHGLAVSCTRIRESPAYSSVKNGGTKGYIVWVHNQIKAGVPIPQEEFLKVRGFLVYCSMTYEFMVPFLKGFHLAVDTFRPGQRKDGWKQMANPQGELDVENREEVPLDEWDKYVDNIAAGESGAEPLAWDGEADPGFLVEEDKEGDAEVPDTVPTLPRLVSDVAALESLLHSETPLMIPVRPIGAFLLTYGFGDASGEGFGSAWIPSRLSKVRLRRGFWCSEVSEKSSNYRELRNLVEAVKDLHETSDLTGMEIWLFTDNKVAEAVYAKGNSDNKLLFELMLELRLLSLQIGFILHIVHISGTRMIAEGTDGLSRGELQLGGFLEEETQVVPLHLDPVARSNDFKEWVSSWFELAGTPMRFAQPIDWPYNAHQPGAGWVWCLPPAAALYALEELAMGSNAKNM